MRVPFSGYIGRPAFSPSLSYALDGTPLPFLIRYSHTRSLRVAASVLFFPLSFCEKKKKKKKTNVNLHFSFLVCQSRVSFCVIRT